MSSTSVVDLDAAICWHTWYSTCMTACVLVSIRTATPVLLC